MKRAQVNLEDATWSALEQLARAQGVTVADLIRAAVEEKYIQSARERVEAFRAWKAPWRDRDDIGDSSEYIRQLREDDRLDRIYSE
jgi:hypothetical protein